MKPSGPRLVATETATFPLLGGRVVAGGVIPVTAEVPDGVHEHG